jgi:sulfur-oxidizing protein SoxX
MKHTGIIALAGVILLPALGLAAGKPAAGPVEKGRALAYDMNKGNCLACHMMADGESPGNFGPPMVQMKERYPDRALLRKQIWDATAANPRSVMPPFGKHGVLSEQELDEVVDYLYSL